MKKPWTLRRTLVIGFSLLFIVGSAIADVVTISMLERTLTTQVDHVVSTARIRAENPRDTGPQGRQRGSTGGGLVRVTIRNGEVISATVGQRGNDAETLSPKETARMVNATLTGRPVTVDLGDDTGEVRAVRAMLPNGDVQLIGSPLTGVHSTSRHVAGILGLVSGVVVLLTVFGTWWVVRRALRPLSRVAHTATTAASRPLDRGTVLLPDRVADQDTHPDTEVGAVGAALNDLLEHVNTSLVARQASEERIRRFVADASHELRTPLTTIRGYAEWSRRDHHQDPAQVEHALTRIEAEATRMSGLVDDLLTLARLDSGRAVGQEPVDLSAIILDAVMDAKAAGRDHIWHLDLPSEPVEIVGDLGGLTQVVVNLLANCRIHTPAGTVVLAALQPGTDTVTITISDNGPGIPPHLLPELFSRFTRGDEARVRAGGSTGLGMSIVQAMVHAHGGSVTATSQPGSTAVVVNLPVHGTTSSLLNVKSSH